MTFDPHPPRVIRPDKAPPLLMTLDQKIEAFTRAGVDAVVLLPAHESGLNDAIDRLERARIPLVLIVGKPTAGRRASRSSAPPG